MLRNPKANTSDLIAEAREYLAAIEFDLPLSIEGVQFSCPYSYRAASLRELLRHRMLDLTLASISLLEQDRVVPAAIISRAATETVALLYALHHEIAKFLRTPDESRIEAFLKTALVGSRNPDHPIQATNILNAIDKLDKEIPAFRLCYDGLSEFAHPNWSGVLGSYGNINHAESTIALGNRDNSKGMRAAAFVTASALSTFCYYYDSLADLLRSFDNHFDSAEPTTGGA